MFKEASLTKIIENLQRIGRRKFL